MYKSIKARDHMYCAYTYLHYYIIVLWYIVILVSVYLPHFIESISLSDVVM